MFACVCDSNLHNNSHSKNVCVQNKQSFHLNTNSNCSEQSDASKKLKSNCSARKEQDMAREDFRAISFPDEMSIESENDLADENLSDRLIEGNFVSKNIQSDAEMNDVTADTVLKNFASKSMNKRNKTPGLKLLSQDSSKCNLEENEEEASALFSEKERVKKTQG